MPSFDMEAFILAVLIGIGVAFVTGMIGFFVTSANHPRIPVLIMGGCGLGILSAVAAFCLLPTRSDVPVLDNLSQTELKTCWPNINSFQLRVPNTRKESPLGASFRNHKLRLLASGSRMEAL